MQGIYKILNKSKNENTFYFELCSGCITYVYDFVVKGKLNKKDVSILYKACYGYGKCYNR